MNHRPERLGPVADDHPRTGLAFGSRTLVGADICLLGDIPSVELKACVVQNLAEHGRESVETNETVVA